MATLDAVMKSAIALFTVFGALKAGGWPARYLAPFEYTIFVFFPHLIILICQLLALLHRHLDGFVFYNGALIMLIAGTYSYGLSLQVHCMANQGMFHAAIWVLVKYYEAYFSFTSNKSAYIFSMSAATYALSYYINKHP